MTKKLSILAMCLLDDLLEEERLVRAGDPDVEELLQLGYATLTANPPDAVWFKITQKGRDYYDRNKGSLAEIAERVAEAGAAWSDHSHLDVVDQIKIMIALNVTMRGGATFDIIAVLADAFSDIAFEAVGNDDLFINEAANRIKRRFNELEKNKK